MTLIDREFVSDFLKAFAALLFVVALVVLIDTLLNYYQQVFGSAENGLYWGLVFYVCSLPRTVVEVAPLSAGAAVLWVVSRKSRNNEILAYLAGGISPARLVVPFVLSAVVISAASFLLSDHLIGPAEKRARYVERVHIRQKDASTITLNESIYQKGAGERFYTIEAFDSATETLTRPYIMDLHPESHSPAWVLQAESARFVRPEGGGAGHWVFEDASVRTLDADGVVLSFERHATVSELDLDRRMEDQLQRFLSNLSDPRFMTIAELREYISVLEAQGKEVVGHRTDLHRRIAMPLAALVVVLVTCAHVMRARSMGVLLGLGGGLAYMAGYYALMLMFVEVAEAGVGLPPPLGAWLPNMIYGVLGVLLLVRVGK